LEIKDKLLNPIREDLNKFGLNISLIDVIHAKPLAEILPQIHVHPRPVARPQEPTEKSSEETGGLIALKTKLTIKINPTLLGLQRRPDQHEQREPGTNNTNTKQPQTIATDKPLILFGEEPKVAGLAREGKKGFSTPFGFFNKDQGLRTKDSMSQREGHEPSANNANTKSATGKVVDYSAERAATTPFAKEETLFTTKDQGLKIKEDAAAKTLLEKMFQPTAKPANGNGAKDAVVTPKPVLEAPASAGNVPIQTSPFSFPGKTASTGDGKPKVEGNTVHL
ncbi:MAG: hypothetical protein AAB634_02970, partial [Patescibacteria group bacterium]